MGFKFGAITTPGGYRMDEVASALQKACRRSNVDDALYWATELDLAGYGNYAWQRLKMVASEDIGVANPDLPAQLHALYANWTAEKKKDTAHAHGRNQFVHAVILVAQSKKNRMVNHACWIFYKGERDSRPIPDEAKDMHTSAGRAMGRDVIHFIEESSRVIDPDGSDGGDGDAYEARAHAQARARIASGAPKPTGPTYAGQPPTALPL